VKQHLQTAGVFPWVLGAVLFAAIAARGQSPGIVVYPDGSPIYSGLGSYPGTFLGEGLSRLPPVDEPSLPLAAPAETLPRPASEPAPDPAVAPQADTKAAESIGPTPLVTPLEERIIPLDPGWQVWSPAFWDPWEGSVELGLSGTDGNSETFNVRFGLNAKHKTDRLVQTLQVTSIQKSAEGITTANTALIDGRLEWPLLAERWTYFVHGLWEYDEFKAFNYRVSGDTGLGFQVIKSEPTSLLVRSGISASHEVGGPENEVTPELLFGGEFKHKFNPTHSISAKVDYFPNVTDFGDFRLNSQAAWEIALSQAWGMSLKLSVIDRYDSTPQGARPNDLDYSTLLLWTF
jgi:putative salt-induced outer membrane protein YdiY